MVDINSKAWKKLKIVTKEKIYNLIWLIQVIITIIYMISSFKNAEMPYCLRITSWHFFKNILDKLCSLFYFILFYYMKWQSLHKIRTSWSCDPSPRQGRIALKGLMKVKLFYALPILTYIRLLTVKQLMLKSRAASSGTVRCTFLCYRTCCKL